MKRVISDYANQFPAHWKVQLLKRLFTVSSGDFLSPDDESDEGFPVYGGNGMRGYASSPNCSGETLLIGRVGALCGNVHLVYGDFWYSEHALRVFPRARFDNGFIKHLLAVIDLNRFANRTAQPLINGRTVTERYAGIPPLPEQQRIAAYLDASCAAIDRAVATKQQQLETLDALRKSIIQKAVTQGLNPDVEMKVVPMDGVGLVPKHWRVKQLRYCCQISYGITLQLEAGKTDGVPILTVQNLDIHGDWKFDQEFCIDEELVHEDDILRQGDLLFNWRNGSAKHVGKTAFFNLEGRYTHVSFLLRMRCGKDLNPFYLKSYLGALRMAGFFEGAKDKVNKTFNSTELNRLSVLVPPIKEQDEIVKIVHARWDEIENVRKVIQSQIETLTAYRKSLIHECVTGQRRISEADVAHAQAHV